MKTDLPNKLGLTEMAYGYIFYGIVNGRYHSGQSLNPDMIVKTLSMSKPPIREALLQLESEAAYLATTRKTPELTQELRTALDALKRMNRADDPDPIRLADLNGKFHSIIASGSGNRHN